MFLFIFLSSHNIRYTNFNEGAWKAEGDELELFTIYIILQIEY